MGHIGFLNRNKISLLLLSSGLIAASGCASGVYRASNLPREYWAPSTVNLEEVNLSGLTERSLGVDQIQRGDVLEVAMLTDFSKMTATTTPLRVADDGTIVVPLVGRVAVAGLELEQAEATIAAESKSRGIFVNPSLTVTMKQRHVNRVTVVGAVNNPGAYELVRGSNSLLAGILAAGGLSKEAGPDVEIRHTVSAGKLPSRLPNLAGGAQSDEQLVNYASYQPAQSPAEPTKINLVAASKQGRNVPDLQDGDVVNVVKLMPKPIYVLGLVHKPGEFPLPVNQTMRLLDALAMAGGTSNPAAEKVLLIRQLPDKPEPVRIELSINNAKSGGDNLQLASGDTVVVEQTPATVVVDTVQTFFRFGFSGSIPMF
jgi:polysaccharide biosynthesis/export protein